MEEIESKDQAINLSVPISSTNDLQPKPKVRCIEVVAMICLGLINNIFFLIIMSSAQRIVDHFNRHGDIGIVEWSCTVCGLFANAINSLLTTYNVSYDIRFAANTIFMAIGLFGSAFSPDFWFACASIVFIGFSCNFGESVCLGYLVFIQKQHYVKFWGMGTGAAGVLGSCYSALCTALVKTDDEGKEIKGSFNYKLSFECLIPLIIIYFCCYFFVIRVKKKNEEQPLLDEEGKPSEIFNKENVEEEEKHSGKNNLKMWCNCSFLRKIMYYILTIDSVYFCQYVIASAFLDCAQKEEHTHMKFLFPLLSLTQHVGVLIFASSLNWFKCYYLISIAVAQLINFGIWLSQAMLHWMPIWAEFIFIFLVGCCGGLNYVNTYDMEMSDDKLDDKEKELGSNLLTFSVTISVVISSGFTLLSEKTFLKDFVPHSKPDNSTNIALYY